MQVKYVDFAIGNNFGNYVELNKNLKLYPRLHDAILKHELQHTNIQGFTTKDLMLDLSTPSDINTWDLIKFMFRHPKSMIQLLPFYRSKGVYFYDVNMLIIWALCISIISLVFVLLL